METLKNNWVWIISFLLVLVSASFFFAAKDFSKQGAYV